MATVADALVRARLRLERLPDVVDPALEARIILEDVTGERGHALVLDAARGLTGRESALVTWTLDRRATGTPLAYCLGHWEFFGLDLLVGPAALIPRPETELLVQEVLARRQAAQDVRVCDLGTGTGAIALALKAQRPRWQVVAVESSRAALSLASRNARRLNLGVTLLEHDFLCPLPGGPYDLIVANPPYIPSREVDRLPGSVLAFEPREALDGGPTGLSAHEAVLSRAAESLVPSGMLAVELAAGQAGAYCDLAARRGMLVDALVRDLAGHERVAIVRPGRVDHRRKGTNRGVRRSR